MKKINERWLEVDYLLPGPRSSGVDVPGQSECATTEVQGGDGFARGSHRVDGVPNPADVVESEQVRMPRLYARLGSVIHVEGPGTRSQPGLCQPCKMPADS